MKRNILIFFIMILMALYLTGCAMKAPITDVKFAMDTVINTKLYGAKEEDLTAISELLDNCEKQLIEEVPPEANSDLDQLMEVTGGAFDHRIGKLIELWGIGTDAAKVPSQTEIDAVLSDRSKFHPGAYGKGYACDVLRSYLNDHDIEGACIAVGGSILCYGSHDGTDEYTVGIRDPRGDATDVLGTIKVKDKVVSTSGDYERVFEQDGKKYHHILDPHTGYPVQSGLSSVTVVSESGLLSDALSTAAFALGLEKGMDLLKLYNAEGVFIDNDMNVFVTEGVKFDPISK